MMARRGLAFSSGRTLNLWSTLVRGPVLSFNAKPAIHGAQGHPGARGACGGQEGVGPHITIYLPHPIHHLSVINDGFTP